MVNDCLDPGISNVITIVNEIVPLFSMWGFIVVIIGLHEMAVQVKANEQSSLLGFMTPDSFSLLISIHIHLHHFIAQWTVFIDSGINFHEQWLGYHWQCRRFIGNESIQNENSRVIDHDAKSQCLDPALEKKSSQRWELF